jgi:dienelactone hydrolase
MHILAAVVLWGELAAGPHAAGFRTLEAQSASGTYPPKTRAMEIALWYPAERSEAAPIAFGEYFRIAEDLRRRSMAEGADAKDAEAALAGAIGGTPEAVPRELARKILASPMAARRDAAALSRKFPLVIWGSRYGTTAAQALLSEYLATHGYVVAFARPKEEREKMPFEAGSPGEKLAELDAQADDLRGALRAVRELPFVDGDRTGVVTWSYAGESAVRIQQADARVRVVIGLDSNVRGNWVYRPADMLAALESAPLVPYVLFTKGTPPFEQLNHGNFNFIEGMLPALFDVTRVQAWSRAGPAAARGYEALAREVRRTLDTHLDDAPALPQQLELKNDDATVTADVYRAAKPRGCVALFHQSGSSRGEHRLAGPLLAADGFTAISADLRWGRRDHWHDVWNETARTTGAIATVDRGEREKFEFIRQGAKGDARAAIRWLRENCKGPLIVWGSSIHANAALDLAVGEEAVDAVIALSPGEYSNAVPDLMRKRVAELRKPALVVWGRDEEEVSQPVFAAIPAGKKTSFVSAGRHGIATLHEDPRAWLAVREWLRRMVE